MGHCLCHRKLLVEDKIEVRLFLCVCAESKPTDSAESSWFFGHSSSHIQKTGLV